MPNVNLVGTWKLQSIIARTPNGDTGYPWGENPFGRLMYDGNGNVSVFLMKTGRSKFASDDRMEGTAEEKLEAFEGSRAYCGTYEIDEEKGTITHHVEGANFPNWEGTDQLRFFKLSGNRLTLIAPVILVRGKELNVSFTFELKT